MEANHHAITAPGADQVRLVLRKQQPPFAALGHSPPRRSGIAKPTIFILRLRGEKALLPSTLFPASFLQITGGPTDRPTTGIRRIHRENGGDSTLGTDPELSNVCIKRPSEQSSEHDTRPECGSLGTGHDVQIAPLL